MKTHKKTYIMMLIFCLVITMIPFFAFAEADKPADAEIPITEEEAAEPAAEETDPEGSGEKAEETPERSEDQKAEEQAAEEQATEEQKIEEEKIEEQEKEEKELKEQEPPTEKVDETDAVEKPGPEEKQIEVKTEEPVKKTNAPALRAADNSSVSYTASRHPTSDAVVFKASINGASYTGTCCEGGVKFKSSGSAKISALGKPNLCRKVAYKYSSWLTNGDRNYDMGGLRKGVCFEAMMQYAMAWEKDKAAGSGVTKNRDKTIKYWKSGGGNGWASSTVNKIVAAVKALNGKTVSELGIPGKFRAYWGKITNTTSGSTTSGQDALFWGDLVTGTATVKKVPGRDAAEYIAAHPGDFNAAGAKYQLYTDSACTKKATDVNWNNAVLTTKADGTSNVRTMEVGTYYAKEIKAPKKGYGIAKNPSTGKAKVYTVKVTKGKKTTFTSEEPIKKEPEPEPPVELNIYKTDTESDEDLAGAELVVLDSKGKVIEKWTTDGKGPHVISDLKDGTYTLRETKTPYGYETANDIKFKIVSGELVAPAGVSDDDEDDDAEITMKDAPVSVETTAVSDSTNIQTGMRKTDEKITDTVTMTGLIAGRNYKLEGTLMNKRTGAAISGAVSEKSFKATDHTMEVTMDFTFDATALKDEDSVVVYETLYRTTLLNGETSPVELAKHNNIDDEAQTVTFPDISTTASLQNNNTEVRDVIEYKNLAPDARYVFKGWLVDTATGEKVPDSDGCVELNGLPGTSGEVEMILKTEKYDEMSGHSMTAFEELYIVETEDETEKETLIAEHKDTNDSAQTVEVFQDIKVRKNVTGNLGDLTKVFEYTVEFTGLVPGSAYRIEGDDEKTFMADDDGMASVPLKLKDDQEAVIKKLPKSATYKVTEAASDHI